MNARGFIFLPTALLAGIVLLFVAIPNGVMLLAFSGRSFLAGEIWRILTFPFVHISASHLVENIIALAVASLLAWEIGITKTQYAIAFVTASLIVAFADIVWFPTLVIAGASTGIFAIYGAFAMRGSVFISKGWLVLILGATVFTKLALTRLTGGAVETLTMSTLFHLTGFAAGLTVIIVSSQIAKTTRKRVLTWSD